MLAKPCPFFIVCILAFEIKREKEKNKIKKIEMTKIDAS
jgi:hypothetical protein